MFDAVLNRNVRKACRKSAMAFSCGAQPYCMSTIHLILDIASKRPASHVRHRRADEWRILFQGELRRALEQYRHGARLMEN